MPDLDRPRLALYVVLALAVCLLGARYIVAQASPPAPAPNGPEAAGAEVAGSGDGDASSVRVERADGGRLTVHVAGAVHRPGVYRLRAGARVDDALRSAGGARGRADLTAVNLAARLEDGRQVLVPERAPSQGAPAAGGPGATAAAGRLASGADPAAGTTVAPAAPLNLNTATLEQLQTLDGVGPGIAQRILDYREQQGGFGRVEQLGEVPGIGVKRLATLTPLVTV
ncbi:MAG: ComEA family DNA-binding protein [Solirubrobacteraceae bacterium]|nr:ComEA family DNA-binding protein [Solirubrobacteraceae bacterium]